MGTIFCSKHKKMANAIKRCDGCNNLICNLCYVKLTTDTKDIDLCNNCIKELDINEAR